MRPNDVHVPDEFWRCIECRNPDVYVIVTRQDRTLINTDLIVCFKCGFRFYGKTLHAWYVGGQKQKRGPRKSQRKTPLV